MGRLSITFVFGYITSFLELELSLETDFFLDDIYGPWMGRLKFIV